MRRVLLALLLLLLGLEGGTVLIHEHKDGKLHLDCSVCVLKSSQQIEENPKIEPKKLSFLSFHIETQNPQAKPISKAYTHKHPRAPPV
ncbi:hypothetical protein [Hydrogenobacter hydrogenophilus]|uniref:Uncharacterized protein n=1 Tax=Hydrogenobacter hydrogenophilus TaxID=35835 RepID=A0A285NW64_9AQUI|nr:hypothetical protein [Hydrogenobacter hydrogenophilus]SNZ13705.1 hypothetical protein SAMN06265353_0861 [Hydrogenobacter hydrogenophilus]